MGFAEYNDLQKGITDVPMKGWFTHTYGLIQTGKIMDHIYYTEILNRSSFIAVRLEFFGFRKLYYFAYVLFVILHVLSQNIVLMKFNVTSGHWQI